MPGPRSSPARRDLWAPALWMWGLFLFAQPFYVIATGLPQPGDLLLLPLLPVALIGWNGRLSHDAKRVLRALAWFTVWVAIVDYAWAIALGNWVVVGREGMVLFPLYYLYNLLVVFVGLVLHQRFGETFLYFTLRAVLVTLVMLVVASLVLPGSGLRGQLFFANPNQLGYHALLSGCLIALVHRPLRMPTWQAALALSGCAYLALISASRSAVAGIAVLAVLLMLSNLRLILLTSAAAVLAIQLGGPVARGVEASQTRVLTTRQAHLSFFEQRGYDRLYNNPEHLVFGAGEGATSRFAETTAIGPAEIHSSAAMLLFCYGLVGVLLFGGFLWRLLRGAPLRTALMLVPPLLYTFAHQGLRFSLLWVLLAAFAIAKHSSGIPAIRRGRIFRR